jgi:hypothetical protein
VDQDRDSADRRLGAPALLFVFIGVAVPAVRVVGGFGLAVSTALLCRRSAQVKKPIDVPRLRVLGPDFPARPVYARAGSAQDGRSEGCHESDDNGRNGDRSARTPLDRMTPDSTAVDQLISPVATFTQVTASVSTTFGGVPRV